jgi:hypothetical protein
VGEHNRSKASRNKQSAARDARIIATTACPLCLAPAGVPCRNPIPHQDFRGTEDHRPQPLRSHNERRAEWVATKPKG